MQRWVGDTILAPTDRAMADAVQDSPMPMQKPAPSATLSSIVRPSSSRRGSRSAPSCRLSRPVLLIIFAAATMLTFSMGIRQSLGLLMQPLTRDIGVSVADFALAIACRNHRPECRCFLFASAEDRPRDEAGACRGAGVPCGFWFRSERWIPATVALQKTGVVRADATARGPCLPAGVIALGTAEPRGRAGRFRTPAGRQGRTATEARQGVSLRPEPPCERMPVA